MRHKITLRDWLLFAAILFVAFLKLTHFTGDNATDIKSTAGSNPASNDQFNFIEDAIDILCFCVLPVFGIRILLGISKGEAFSKKTINHLFILGWSLVTISLVPGIASLLQSLISHKQLSNNAYSLAQSFFLQHKDFLLAGLVILLMARAFHKGYVLQEEINHAL
jgi:hypothetical protein